MREREDEVLVCFRRGEADRVCVAVNLMNAPQTLRLPVAGALWNSDCSI